MSARILVVEDETHLAEGLRFNLEAEGYKVEIAGDGESALTNVLEGGERYDAIVLDVMLPGKDGFKVVSELRAVGQYVPVLMLTALGRPEDVLLGFESGADDYLPKPFELSVLIARINGLLRRREWFGRDSKTPVGAVSEGENTPPGPHAGFLSSTGSEDVYKLGDRTIDFGALELRTGEQVVRLTLMEADLLRYLLKHQGRIVSRKAMLEDVWGLKDDTDTRAIDNFIVRLRRYLEDEPSKPKHLLTVRGVGYRFEAAPPVNEKNHSS